VRCGRKISDPELNCHYFQLTRKDAQNTHTRWLRGYLSGCWKADLIWKFRITSCLSFHFVYGKYICTGNCCLCVCVCVCGAGFAIEIQLLVSFFAAAQKAQKKKGEKRNFFAHKKKRTSSYSAWLTSVCVSLISGECHLAIHTWLQLQRHNFEQLSAGFRDGAYVHALWGWLTVSCVVRVFIAASVCVCVSLFLGQDFS